MTIELGEEELLGAHLLARMDGLDSRDAIGFDGVLASSLRHGVADRRAAAGIAWPPTADAFELADRVGREVASDGPPGDGRGSAQAAVVAADREIATGQVRRMPQALGRNAAYCATAVVVIAVLLIGGYALHWSWTGFTANNQL